MADHTDTAPVCLQSQPHRELTVMADHTDTAPVCLQSQPHRELTVMADVKQEHV